MSFFKYAFGAALFGVTLYNVVDDKTRAEFDYGMEKQSILLTEMRHNTYFFIWEFFGAHDDEIAAQSAKLASEIDKRKEKLKEKFELRTGQRSPAVDESKKYEKYLAK